MFKCSQLSFSGLLIHSISADRAGYGDPASRPCQWHAAAASAYTADEVTSPTNRVKANTATSAEIQSVDSESSNLIAPPTHVMERDR